jgi:hypothetical protein
MILSDSCFDNFFLYSRDIDLRQIDHFRVERVV